MSDLSDALRKALESPEDFERRLTDFLTSKDKIMQLQGRIAASTLPEISSFMLGEASRDPSPKALGSAAFEVATAMGFFMGLGVGPRLKQEKIPDFAVIISTAFLKGLITALEVEHERFHVARN